jgi:dTDP-4-amino-4,6-dideoxygalactose transaminase
LFWKTGRRPWIIRSQGESPTQKYEHPLVGYNYRLTDLHAAIGIGQFSRVDALFAKRHYIAGRYSDALKGLDGIKLPVVREYNEHAFFLYTTLVDDRDGLRRFLSERGISTNVSWPKPIYRQQPYSQFSAYRCPVAEYVCDHVLCLPSYYQMTEAEQEHVIETIRTWSKR